MYNFKSAKHTDANVLALLGRITYAESHGNFIEKKEDLLAYCDKAFSVKKTSEDLHNKNNLFHIVYYDDLPVGYSKIILQNSFKSKTDSNSCRLERIYILADYIPKKIGQHFLEFIIAESKKANATSMWLSVYFKNKRAINFYTKNEFKNIGELNFNVNGKEYVTLVLSKKI